MKTIIASIVLIGLMITEVDAQTTAGNFLIGGTGTLQRSKVHVPSTSLTSNTGPTSSFSINPTIGYFPVNNFMVGVQGNYIHAWQNPDNLKIKTNSFAIGPILRYYIPFGGKFAAFPEVAASYNKVHSKSKGEFDGAIIDDTFNNITYVYRAGAGVTWFVRPNVGVEMVLAYRQTNQKSRSGYNTLLYSSFALQFYFSRKTNAS